jgi:uncharacterized integral membrane protein
MQLLLILGIVFGIGSVAFALQNNAPVTVTVASWQYDSTLALVLLATLAIGALVAGLVSTPGVIKGQWTGTRLRRQIAMLVEERTALRQRVRDLESVLPGEAVAALPVAGDAATYVGMRAILAGQAGDHAS